MPGPIVQELARQIYTRSQADDLAAHLESTYDVQIAGTQRLEGFTTRVDFASGPSWVARVMPAARPLGLTEGDAVVLSYLEEMGFPAERCARSDAVSVMDGQAVLVTRYVEGAKAAGSLENLRRLGDLLGRLQELPPSRATAREAGSLHHWSMLGGGLRADLDAAASWLEEARADVAESERGHFETLVEHVRSSDDLSGLPMALIHPDFYPENVIESAEGELVLVDWAGAGTGARLQPLAFLMWQAAARGWRSKGPAAVDAIVDGYKRHCVLEPEELARLPGAMLKPPLVLDCFLLALGRKSPADAAAALPSLTQTAEAIAARARAAFAG